MPTTFFAIATTLDAVAYPVTAGLGSRCRARRPLDGSPPPR
jgi:hypothetical protein